MQKTGLTLHQGAGAAAQGARLDARSASARTSSRGCAACCRDTPRPPWSMNRARLMRWPPGHGGRDRRAHDCPRAPGIRRCGTPFFHHAARPQAGWPTWLDKRCVDTVTVDAANVPAPARMSPQGRSPPWRASPPPGTSWNARLRRTRFQAPSSRSVPIATCLWRFASGALTYERGGPAVRDDTIYDLASLTKVLSTSALVMREIERGAIALDDTLPRLLPGCRNPALAGVTVEDVLAHCAGFPAYRPFYRTQQGEDAFEARICATPLEYVPRAQSIYSDLGFHAARHRARPRGGTSAAVRRDVGADGDRRRSAVPPARALAIAHRADRTGSVATAAARAARCTTRTPQRSAASPGMPVCSAPQRPWAPSRAIFFRYWTARTGASRSPRCDASSPAATEFRAARARWPGTRCGRPRRAARACRPRRSATPASPAPRCGSIPQAASTSCC